MESRKRFRTICLIFFAIYVLGIVYFLLLSDIYGRIEGYTPIISFLTIFIELKINLSSHVSCG